MAIFGDWEAALMCACKSVRSFELEGHADGIIASRLDELDYALRLPPTERLVDQARSLLHDVRRLKENDPSFVTSEIASLCLLAEALLALPAASPRVIVAEFSDDDEQGELSEPIDDDTAPRQEEAASQAEADSLDDGRGFVLAGRFVIGGQPPYIAAVSVKGVEWFHCVTEAAELAAQHKLRDRWFHIQAQIIERAQNFGQPEITWFFFRATLLKAEEIGFGEPPDGIIWTMLLVLGAALKEAPPAVKEAFYTSPWVSKELPAFGGVAAGGARLGLEGRLQGSYRQPSAPYDS
jgi:hypothetical protein